MANLWCCEKDHAEHMTSMDRTRKKCCDKDEHTELSSWRWRLLDLSLQPGTCAGRTFRSAFFHGKDLSFTDTLWTEINLHWTGFCWHLTARSTFPSNHFQDFRMINCHTGMFCTFGSVSLLSSWWVENISPSFSSVGTKAYCWATQEHIKRCAGYSRLRPDLSKVVEELRQVGLEQTLKLQAQRHDTLREHMCTS